MRKGHQHGVVMVIALIMLAVVTLIGTVSANIVMGNLQVVQNIEAAAASRSNAVSAMQEAMMATGFLAGQGAFGSGCQGSNDARCFDMTGDGASDDMKVSLSLPDCKSIQPILTNSLSEEVWLDDKAAACWFDGGGQYSPCADVLWEVDITAEDQVTQAKVRMRQGLTTRAPAAQVTIACEAARTSG